MKYTFKDICTKIGSGATPTGGKEAYKGGDYALVRSQNVLDYTFTTSGLAYINETQAKKLDGVKVESGDVLLNITGDSVARACIIPDEILPARVNQHVAIIRANNQYALNEYLLYFLQYNKQYLLSISQGGGTRSAITKKMIEDIEIDLPSIEDQLAIVNIINSISKKIEVNQQINDNLEQQAQALYKSWFIDFEPFKDGKFEESEIGLIPEGWHVGKAEDFYEINIGKTPPRKEHEWFTLDKGQNIWVSISDLGSDGRFLFDSSEYLTDKAIQKHNIVLVPEDTVLLSFKLTIGRVGIAGTQLTTNEAIARFITNSVNREYTYFLLKNFNYSKLGSTSSIATAVNSKIIKAMMVLMPSNECLLNFKKLVGPIIDGIKKNEEEILRLTALRDILLPKLMSGELKINEIDC